jgi:uncharacterized cupin superfamily protein
MFLYRNWSLLLVTLFSTFFGATLAVAEVVKPDKITRDEISGDIFKRPGMTREQRGDSAILDVTSLLSSDKKFVSGMYQAGPGRFEIKDGGYGVDEFMYFLKGSVKLTSEDGSIQVINAGEAVTIPKEWKGFWESDGYTKIYVIYSGNGDLE